VSGGLFGGLSGLCFGYSLNAYRQAGLAMDAGHPTFAAAAAAVVRALVAALAGRRLFNEKLSLIRWIAGAAVAAGVAMTALG
jgi:drug/metabolite transporter (DMT)-like permease